MADAGTQTDPISERLFPSMDILAPALATEISRRLSQAVRERGVASMVVTGGTTPGPVYDALARACLPWERVFITLSDERWVAPDHESSNERLVRARLMGEDAVRARFVALKTADASPSDAQAKVDAAITALPHPFDVVLLGVGGDGHVASLFPGEDAAKLDTPGQARAAHREDAAGSADRLSLTFAALRDARWTALLIKGQEKLALSRRARDGGDVNELPVRGILVEPAGPVEIWWTS